MDKPKQASRAARTGARGKQHHGNRHGRSEDARQAVLEAADDLLVERGFAGVTVEGIAAKAGVAKQTIYRWWGSKTDVLMDAFLDDATQHLTPPDLGTLEADLCSHLHQYVLFFARSDAGAVFRALIGEAQHDAALAAELRAKYLSQQRARDRLPFQRAMERGELPSDCDVDLIIDQLIAPIHYRILVSGERVTRGYTDGLVRRVLAQFTP